MLSTIVRVLLSRQTCLTRLSFRKTAIAFYSTIQRYSSTHVEHPHSFAFGRSDLQLQDITIGQALEQRAQTNPNQIAIHSEHESLSKSFAQLQEDVLRLSSSLHSDLGLRRGDVVALWSANCYNWLVIQYAAARIGLILCTLNPVYKETELQYALLKSDAKALFMPSSQTEQFKINSYSQVFANINSDELPSLKHVLLIEDGQLKKCNGQLNVDKISSLISKGTLDYKLKTDEIVNADDPAIIMFTSGTTGKPKGALLSHSNLVNNAYLTGHRLGLMRDPSNTIACIPVPLFHIFGMVYGNVMMSRLGMTTVLPGYKYSVEAVLDAINRRHCSHIMMVPAMTVDILNHVQKTNAKVPSLKTVITGSAPTPVEVAKKFLHHVPNVKEFLIRYGSTETGGCMTMPHIGDEPNKTIDNVGAPLDFVQIKLIDPKTRNVVKIGEQGELWARGHNVMLGYWKDEVKTNEEITKSRWFKSGDMATMDKEGRIRLVGRTKEMIIRGGENIYPKEIEELLHRHDAVQDVFICGVPDNRMGEEICAWIKLNDAAPKLTVDDIRSFCKEQISYFKVPKYVLFVDEFPRTPTGKAQKFEMTKQSIEILNLHDQQSH